MEYRDFSSRAVKARHLDGNRINSTEVGDFAWEHLSQHQDELFFRKLCDYSDEAEYRFVVFHSKERYFYLPIDSMMVAVIVGDRFHPVYKPLIEQLSNELECEFHSLRWHNGTPRLAPWVSDTGAGDQ